MKLSALLLLFIFSCATPTNKQVRKRTGWAFVEKIQLEFAPTGVVEYNGEFYITDVAANRIVKFDPKFKYMREWTDLQRPMLLSKSKEGVLVAEYGATDYYSSITANRLTKTPLNIGAATVSSIAIHDDKIAIADFYGHHVLFKSSNGLLRISEKGHEKSQLYYPTDVEINSPFIYVADAYNHRIQVFDFNGDFIRSIGAGDGIQVATGIKVSPTTIAVADFEGNRVLIYQIDDGRLLQILIQGLDHPSDIEIVENKMIVTNYKSKSISIYEKEPTP